MAGLPPGDPQLVSMIVSHLKTQGLFDQFRRDCLADVDTKPAYLNLKQRVDNFVSNHLSNHTWSPHLNKNQLRNNIRQLVLQSGMLEQGVDRIVAQVVDPKVNHLFRPQVERVVREFLSPGSCSEEPPAPPPPPPIEIKPDSSIILEQASTSSPATTSARDAMSILDTITSLNQEASVWASSATDRGHRGQASDEGEQDMSMDEDGDMHQDNDGGNTLEETEETTPEGQALEVKTEDPGEQLDQGKDGLIEEVKMEEEESGSQEQMEGEKDKAPAGKATGKVTEEKQEDEDDLMKSTSSHARQKARERIKEEYFLEDSDLDGLSDITVSSVHTSDLSSFEGESENEELLSDSSEEGELSPDDQDEGAEKKEADGDDRKPRRKAYVHKPFLYSRYYSDSDDEVTVEERRRSAAKDKEERLLKRQQNRERMEEKRKQKAVQVEEDYKKQKSGDSAGLDGPRAKEARKERKVLEKKMALNRKRKLDSRKDGDVSSKKKGDAEGSKKTEVKPTTSKTLQSKLIRNPSESASPDERHRRTSGSVSEDSTEARKHCDKGRTHSFILELEQGSQEALKQRSLGKFDRSSRKELHSKERREKERSLSDERAKPKQKPEKKSEHQAEDSQQKPGAKVSSEEKGEKRPKIKMEKKAPGTAREVRSSVSEGAADEVPKDSAVKKAKAVSAETVKPEKEKNREKDKDKGKEKEKAKGEKSSAKGDFKPLVRLDSAGSSEDRSDMEPGSDGSKKKDKHFKEVLKRSKSHSEDRPADKPKSKTDGTDTEKEKTKDQDGQKSNKSNSDVDKDSKRVKPVAAEKGRVVEKSKSKTKEETKTQQSSKTDKASSSEVKSTGTAAVAAASKPDTAREKRKEGSKSKIHEDSLHDKAEVKSAKKKLEKKNKDDSQEEEKKTETLSDRSSKTSEASEDRQPKKRSLLQDTSTDSEPVATTLTTTTVTSFSDDTCDALSDITPEPPEGETEARLSEMLPSVPAEADALLALMDVCTAAEARLPPDMTLQDADMKMKEAALTLLSMVPDSTVSSALVCPDSSEQVTRPMEQREQQPSQTVEPVDEKPTPTDVSEASEKESEKAKMSDSAAPQEVDTTLNECPAPFNQDKAKGADMAPETRADESVATPAAGKEAARVVVSETEEGSTAAVVSDSSKKVFEISSKQDLTEPAVADTETSPKEGDVVAEEAHSEMDVDNSEAESKTVEERNAGTGESDPKTVELDVPEKTDVIRETGAGVQSTLVKQISNVSSIDSQDDEKGSDLSEKEGKAGGRGGRKRKLSSQSVAAVKESGDERDENERKEGPPAEVVEVKTPRRGRSSRAGEEAEKDQAKESMEETASRGRRRSGAAAKEATADDQKKDGNKEEKSTDKSSSIKPADSKERCEEESGLRKSGRRGSQVNPPSPVPEDTEAAGSSESKEAADTRKPAVKRKRSEDMEESVEETQTEERVQMDSQQEPSEEQTEIDSVSQVEDQEEDKEDKPDDVDEELTQDDQETTPKRPGRRGRPSRGAVPAAAMEDPEKKAEESEQNDDEEADDGDGKKGAAKRATTRAASRLEAEKNKPSKPSTRASRQSGKEETAAGTRGTRGQAAAAAAPKGGQRKREASPPAVRTRGGQKSEEPPSKRAKR